MLRDSFETSPLDVAPDTTSSSAAYAEHLAEINVSRDVVTSRDIVNSQGILLLKQGQRINKDAVARIVQFKLMQPLEASIAISGALTESKLLHIAEKLFANDTVKKRYFEATHADALIACQQLFSYPLLAQKLTVLSLQMPQEFVKSILVAWTGLVAASRLQFSMADKINFFIAALMQEIGLLHIRREILTKKDNITHDEWRAIKSHTIVGSKILEQIGNLPAGIARAVYEHHERCDGTGYPVGKFAMELSLPGQLIGILDSVFAIYFNKLAPKNLGTRFLGPHSSDQRCLVSTRYPQRPHCRIAALSARTGHTRTTRGNRGFSR